MDTHEEICAECEEKEVEQGKFRWTLLIQQVVEENLAKVLARCVDGRYLPEDAKEAPLAVPGADAGIFAIVWAVLKDILKEKVSFDDGFNQKVINAYAEVRWGWGNLRFHKDDHDHSDDDPKNPLKWCGYMGVLHKHTGQFGLSFEDIEVIDQFVNQAEQWWAKVIELEGDHKEEAVVIVETPWVNVLNITKEQQQVFVYNRALLEQFFQAFWPAFIKVLGLELKIKASDLVDKSMKTMEEHVETTLERLNASNLPKVKFWSKAA